MRILVLAVITVLSVYPVQAAEESATNRLDRIKEDIADRRKIRQRAYGARGTVFAPEEFPEGWLKQKRELEIDEEALGFCGQILATLTQKEVMVSGRIAKKEISLYLESATGEEALAAFRKLLEEHGIVIVPVGVHTLALVHASEVLK